MLMMVTNLHNRAGTWRQLLKVILSVLGTYYSDNTHGYYLSHFSPFQSWPRRSVPYIRKDLPEQGFRGVSNRA